MNVRIVLAITALLAIIATSSWFLYRDDIRQALRPSPSNLPDFQLDGFTYTEHDAQGRVQYVLKGRHLDHYPANDRYLIDTVHIDAYSQGQPLWKADAKRAVLSGEDKTVLLQGKTRVTYRSEPGAAPITLDSADVLLQTRTDVASSQSPTRVRYPQGTLQSEGGFTIDGKTRILTMQGSVRGEVKHD